MADSAKQPANGSTKVPDGRFGEKFDDEIKASLVLWSTFVLAVLCVLGMWITWVMQSYYADRAEAAKAPPSPIAEANEQRVPLGPLLQNDPEGELEALRHEMAQRLGSYGWVDESAGLVHIPIEQAIDLVAAQASTMGMAAPALTEEASADEAPAEGAPASESQENAE